MRKTERIQVLICLIAILSNIFWCDFLLKEQFVSYEAWQTYVKPWTEEYLLNFISGLLEVIVGIFIFPIISWALPLLVYANLRPFLLKYLRH